MTDPTQGLPVDRTAPVPRAQDAPRQDPTPAAGEQGPPSHAVQPDPWRGPAAAQHPVDDDATATGDGERPWWADPAASPAQPTAPAARPTAPPARRRRERRGLGPVVAAAAVAGLLGGLAGGVLAEQLTEEDEIAPVGAGTEGQGAQEPAPVPAEADGTVTGLSRAVLPSVALISVGPDGEVGQGSGFVIREDGYLLTNHHVVEVAEDGVPISVELPGQAPMAAQVVGSDPVYDIAVLRVERTGLAALPFADSDQVQVGQAVVAVGAPLGLDSTVTSGIVSALDRPVVAGQDPESMSYINAIQTDAAINPGNSGGPLLDLAGRVVGVNSAIAQMPTGSFGGPAGSIGLGFAIPAEQAERTATQLIETGSSQHPVIGVHIDLEYTGDGARVLPFSRDGADPVIPGGPAEEAGVRPGDVIVQVDGTRVRDSAHLLVLLRSYAVGETVELVLQGEDGQERAVSIILAGSGE